MKLTAEFDGPFLIGENLVVNLRNVTSLRLVENISRHLSGDTLDGYKLYIDDIVAFSCSVERHDDIVTLVATIYEQMRKVVNPVGGSFFQ